MSEERLVPKLRFVEFKDGWKSKTLGEISEIYGRIGFRGYTVKDLVSEGEGALTLGGKHINSNNRLDLSEPDYLSWDKYEESPEIKVSKGDIITSQRGTLGRSAYIFNDIGKATINPSMVLLKKFKEDGIFLYYTLIHQNFIKEVYRRSSSTAVPMISQSELKKININFPSLNEQKKIANFLSNVDEKLELLNQKLNQTTQFKKYLMQNIFSQKLRFNFIDDWDVVKLETLIEKGKAGGTPPSTNPDYYNGEIPFLSIKDMTEQGKYIVKTEKSITEEGLNNSSAWIIPKYSLLYSIYASIGLVSINLTEVSTSQAIYGIILKEGVSLEYMYYYLTYFKKNIHRYVETGTQGNLNAKLLKSFEIALPSVDEQEMIVNILSLVDKKIENMEKEVGKMNEFKKGLLQQMFI